MSWVPPGASRFTERVVDPRSGLFQRRRSRLFLIVRRMHGTCSDGEDVLDHERLTFRGTQGRDSSPRFLVDATMAASVTGGCQAVQPLQFAAHTSGGGVVNA